MSKMMIYAALTATGGNIENVYGHKMRVKTIDASDKDAVDQAKADGWYKHAQDVIDAIEGAKLAKENAELKGDIEGLDKVTELESQLAQALTEIAELEQKLAVYETAADDNNDGVVSYDEMTTAQLQELLKQRSVEFKARDNKDTLIQLATDSE